MFFQRNRNTWVPDKFPAAGATAAVAAAPAAAPAPAQLANVANAASKKQAIDVAVANATRTMGTALSGLAEQFSA